MLALGGSVRYFGAIENGFPYVIDCANLRGCSHDVRKGWEAGVRHDPGMGGKEPMDLASLEASARRASTLLKAMGNTHRLMILCQLVDGEKCVSELERVVGLSQSALSQHLARLRRDDLVATRRSAQTIYYSLAGAEARAVISTLHDLYCDSRADAGGAETRHAEPLRAGAGGQVAR